MKAKFIKESINDIFKPKDLSDEEQKKWDEDYKITVENVKKLLKGFYDSYEDQLGDGPDFEIKEEGSNPGCFIYISISVYDDSVTVDWEALDHSVHYSGGFNTCKDLFKLKKYLKDINDLENYDWEEYQENQNEEMEDDDRDDWDDEIEDDEILGDLEDIDDEI